MKILIILFIFASASADSIDNIRNKMESVHWSNCFEKPRDELLLPIVPGQYKNSVDEAKILALTRAFVFTITNQKLNRSVDFQKQPDLVYHQLSSAASVTSASQDIVGAGLYFAQNKTYPNWYHSVPFNRTLNWFAPYAMRASLFSNGLRDLDTTRVKDDSLRNYSNTEWYRSRLPDSEPALDSVTKRAFTVSDDDGDWFTSFFGVNGDDPVSLTTPYFDCGRTNRWIVTASAPVVDYLARYTFWTFLRRPQFVAVSTVDVDFSKIDINPCEYSADNPQPNIFAGTHKCKASTDCRAVRGHGFSRFGYECVCKPGYTYPSNNPGPYEGRLIEEATSAEYEEGFECVPCDDVASECQVSSSNNNWAVQRVNMVSMSNCSLTSPQITLPENSGIQGYFEDQTVASMRLAQFLSSMLQASFTSDTYYDLKAMKNLNKDEIFSEVAGSVLGDDKIAAGEIVIKTKSDGSEELFSVYVKRARDPDAERLTLSDYNMDVEVDAWTEEMFIQRNNLWPGSFETNQLTVASEVKVYATDDVLEEIEPWTYEAPSYAEGVWSTPEFSCTFGQWIVNYTLPILGFDDAGTNIERRGETTLTVLVPTSILREMYSET